MLEELTVPFFIALLLLPLGIALFGLGWALRSYRCRYELDNALASARRDAAVSAGGAKASPASGSASSASSSTPASTTRTASAAPAKKAAAKKTASKSAASKSAKVEYTDAQQKVLDRTAEEAVKYTSGKVEADDLTKLKGVAKVLNGKLNDFGVYSYEQIGKWKKADVDAFGELLAFRERIDKDDWIGQAKSLYKEKYGKALK